MLKLQYQSLINSWNYEQAATLQTGKGSGLSLRKVIEETVKSKHPVTVGQLAQMVMAGDTADDVEFAVTVKAMVNEGAFSLQEAPHEIKSALDYIFTLTLSGWLWATLGIAALSLIAVTLTPDIFPLSVVRWVLGSIFVLYLPGYTLLQLLFSRRSDLDPLERFALSVGVSLAVVPLIGLLLNFTPWGIRFAPITASLGAFTIVTAVAAATRKYMEIRE